MVDNDRVLRNVMKTPRLYERFKKSLKTCGDQLTLKSYIKNQHHLTDDHNPERVLMEQQQIEDDNVKQALMLSLGNQFDLVDLTHIDESGMSTNLSPGPRYSARQVRNDYLRSEQDINHKINISNMLDNTNDTFGMTSEMSDFTNFNVS